MNGQQLLETLLTAQAEGRDLNSLELIVSNEKRPLQEVPVVAADLNPIENILVIFTW